jgi:chemotaxis protein MotB
VADKQQPVIIIRKKKKGGHAGHHGGAWKVAYADFVTAMMSFFLLLWLLNVTTSEQRRGLADYFSPAGISTNESSGAGGIFGGRSITSDSGGEMSDRSKPSTQEVTIPTAGQGEEGDEDVAGTGQGGVASQARAKGEAEAPVSEEAKALAATMKAEEEAFKAAEQLLKQAIMQNPALQQFADQIVIDRTSEGLRIQITDKDKLSMFPSASAVPYERGRDLLTLIGKVIARLPNNISVTGHTDSTPFVTGSRRDNWSLSTERANTSREYLVKAGVDDSHIARVSGLADRELFTGDPKDPRNRRISIVLLRKSPHRAPPKTPVPQTPGVSASPLASQL